MASSADAGLREAQGSGGGVELGIEAERQEALLVEVAEGKTARRWDAEPAQALGDDVEVLQVPDRTELVLDALNMARYHRKPKNMIHHSDQGSQYTSIAFGKRCKEAGIRPSMGSVGDCYDNAMCESFNVILECELLVKHRFKTTREAALAVFHFIEGFYNPHRRHSALGYLSPADYERRHRPTTTAEPANL